MKVTHLIHLLKRLSDSEDTEVYLDDGTNIDNFTESMIYINEDGAIVLRSYYD